MEKQRARKQKPLPDKGIFLRRNKNKQNKEETRKETKEEDKRSGMVIETNSSAKDEELEVTIISNKEPFVEQIEPQSQSEFKTLKSNRLRKIFSCFLVKNKRSVNLPRSEWLGPTDCTVKKTVKLSALRKVLRQAGQLKLAGIIAEMK